MSWWQRLLVWLGKQGATAVIKKVTPKETP